MHTIFKLIQNVTRNGEQTFRKILLAEIGVGEQLIPEQASQLYRGRKLPVDLESRTPGRLA